MELLIILYIVLTYWAVGVVIYDNKVVVHKLGMFFVQKLCIGLFLGIFLIPIAIIKKFFSK